MEEFQRFVEHLEDPARNIPLVSVCFGLHISECLGLKWSDVDWFDGKLRVDSGKLMSVDSQVLKVLARGSLAAGHAVFF